MRDISAAPLKPTVRERYFVFVSFALVVAGLIIVARSLLVNRLEMVILGVVFIALGAVRLRDYSRRRLK